MTTEWAVQWCCSWYLINLGHLWAYVRLWNIIFMSLAPSTRCFLEHSNTNSPFFAHASHIIWAKMREKMTLHNVWKADWLISRCALTWYHLGETKCYQLVSILLLQAVKDDELTIHTIFIAQCHQKFKPSLQWVFQA